MAPAAAGYFRRLTRKLTEDIDQLDAEDAARALCFLASDESSLMTGTVVDFDQRVVGSFPLRVPQP